MAKKLGMVELNLKLVEYVGRKYCNSKLGFENLENVLQHYGLRILSVETRLNGRGSPPALRVRTTAKMPQHLTIPADLTVVEQTSGSYSHKILFGGIEAALEKRHVRLELVSTRQDKKGSTLALRVKLG